MKKGDIVHLKLGNREMEIIQVNNDCLLCKFWNEIKGRHDTDCFEDWEFREYGEN